MWQEEFYPYTKRKLVPDTWDYFALSGTWTRDLYHAGE